MRIKQLEIIGLKSFANRTVLDFPEGITGIVGPNGCGKSNVVDAIRWVLGEQSPKHLRGDSMEDVIFKGNERLAPAGMAQVALTFENDRSSPAVVDPDLDVSTLPAHFRGLTEIKISRRYFRSGESEYLINNTPCRLKDVTELFLGTGVGSKAYAIIEQGRVEQLINAKPEDRRLLIEEAGGTTLFRSRRMAAERKIERTRENLLRVSDVLRELERQIEYLHRLAKKADQYRVLQDEVRNLDLTLGSLQLARLQARAADFEAEAAVLRQSETACTTELEEIERQRAEKEGAQVAAEAALVSQRESVAALRAECRSTRQRIDFLRQEIDERYRRLAKLEVEAARQAAQLVRLDEAIVGDSELRARCEADLRTGESELASSETTFEAARVQSADAAKNAEVLKGSIRELAAREVEARNLHVAGTRRKEQAVRRWEQVRLDLAVADERLAGAQHAAAAVACDLEILRGKLRSAQGEKEERADRVRSLSQQLRERERRVADLEHLIVQSRSRLQYLEEIQRNYEGYQRGVRSILLDEQRSEGVLGVVADVLGVPEEHERAVAAALGDRLQYVIVRGEHDGADAVNRLRHSDLGRGSFIPLSPRSIPLVGAGAASLNGNTRRLLDVVQVDDHFRPVAEALLGEVVLVPDLSEGLALWQRNGVHVTMVTPQGDVIDATGVITGGSERPIEEEMVSRQRLILELAADIGVCDANLTGERAEVDRLGQDLSSENNILSELDRETHALTLRVVAAEKDEERLTAEIPGWIDRVEVLGFERRAAAHEEGETRAELLQTARELDSFAAQMSQLTDLSFQANENATAMLTQLDLLSAEQTAVRVRIAQHQQRLEGVSAAAQRLQAQRQETLSQIDGLGSEQLRAKAEHLDLCSQLEEATAQSRREEAAYVAADALLPEVQRALQEVTDLLHASDARARELRAQIDETRRSAGQIDVTLAENRLRVENIVQNLREKYGPDTPIPEGSSGCDRLDDEEEVSRRLDAARGRLARIGQVSIGAIDELRELEERAGFLRSQKADLEASILDLERTIQKLNRASKTRFAETFAQVNEKFQEIFPRLFRGGEARLVLTDETNMLETGVEIVVRPPGKRLDTVTLLSGGEKALVAVSLLFSLFLINPTPFCFLDEVDAPLDDANIGRFTQMVREMSAHSQFIVITHNKRTMQAADVLYGVTMQEPGVSKLISVASH